MTRRYTTVAELVKLLQTMPQDATWEGVEGGALVIHGGNWERGEITPDHCDILQSGTVMYAPENGKLRVERYAE